MIKMTTLYQGILFSLLMLSGKVVSAIFVQGGPEIYYFERLKDGGTTQNNILEGGRLKIERIVPFGFYAGLDAFWGSGRIYGHNASGRALISDIDDFIIEGRLGGTLASGAQNESIFTLFAAYGRFKETNAFKPPSPIQYTAKDSFDYLAIGFLSSHNFNSVVSMGLNFEAKFMYNGKSQIVDDPIYDDMTLQMTNEIQARVEVPFVMRCWSFESLFQCPRSGFWEAQLVPFYEYRHFGGREDFPFDFIDTQFNLIGIRLALGIFF